MNAPKYAANTITEYKVEQNMLCGEFGGKARYDLLSVVMICLSEEGISEQEDVLGQKDALTQEGNRSGVKLLGLLSTVLSGNLTPEEKEDILENDYGIATSAELKEDMRLMCNLSDLIEERGMKQGIEQGIKVLVETCKELGISQEDTQARVEKKFELSENAAKEFVAKFWE